MDSLALSRVCILMQNCNGRSMLGLDNSPGCHNKDVGDLMIFNASDINSSIRLLSDANIITSNTSIGTSVNKLTSFLRFVGGDRVKDVMDLDLTVSLAIDHNFLFFGWR